MHGQRGSSAWAQVRHFALRRVEVTRTTWRFRALVAAVLAVVVVVPGRMWLTGIAASLVLEEPLKRADLILAEAAVLPDPHVAAHAALLYREGYAPRIAMVHYVRTRRLDDAGIELPRSLEQLLQTYWKDAGLDSARVESVPVEVVDPVTLNTARQVAEYCRREGIRRVILVSMRFHSRRSTLSYRRFMRPLGIEVLSQPAPTGLQIDTWWKTKDGVLLVGQEYIKWLYYRLATPIA